MKQSVKKTLSILLSLIMIFSVFTIIPLTASAAEASFVKVTEAPEDWSGDYLIVNEDNGVAFNGSASALNSKGNYIGVTISGGEIALSDSTNAAKITIAKFDDGYSIKTAKGTYIGGQSGVNKIDERSDAMLNTISLNDDGDAVIVSDSTTFRYNSTWPGFRYYKSATSQKPVQLYKLTESAPSTYTITWKNYDDTEIGTSTVEPGETPEFSDTIGEIKDKPEDSDYTYTFSGWTPELKAADADAEYKATFDGTAKYEAGYYLVGTMNNWAIEAANLLAENPNNKDELMINGYEFTANDAFKVMYAAPGVRTWFPDNGGNYIINSDGTYDIYFRPDYQGGGEWHYGCIYAVDVTPKTYKVTWKDWDGTELGYVEVTEGDAPISPYDALTRDEDDDYTYTFSGWTDGTNTYAPTDEFTPVTGDITYTATYEATAKYAPGYYLVGTMNNWAIEAANLLAENPQNQGEYMISGYEFTANDAFKVMYVAPGIRAWFPDNGGNYVINSDGIYDIYFRPDYQGGGEWHYGCIYAVDVTPNPNAKNGMVFEYGEVRFYENDQIVYSKGLVQDDAGHYYYINSSGKAVKNCYYSFSTAKANGLMQGGTYYFDENGVMTFPRNGLTFEGNGVIRYYENDQIVYSKGLVQDNEGNYYYINSTGKAVKNCTYSFSTARANGLMPGGTYQFDAQGRMILN